MKKRQKTKIFGIVLFILLIAASAMFCSCKSDEEDNVLGSGKTSFKLEITDSSGQLSDYTVKTDETTVGDALVKIGLIPAESKDAGFFDTLNGIKADYSVDQSYWGFYIDGEYAQNGVFQTNVVKDSVYSFKFEKSADAGAGE